MKTIFALCLLVILASPSRTQTYHPIVDTAKTWSTVHYYGSWTPNLSDYIRFEGDTSINGLVYKQVWRSVVEAQTNWLPNGYIREDGSKHVYYLTWAGGDPNNLIYDFSALPGDTIHLFNDPMGSFLIVTSVDTAFLLNGEPRLRFNLDCYMAGGGPVGQDTWIEGMGSLNGVLQSGSCILVGDTPRLLCFHEHDTLKYFNSNYSGCFVITGTREHLEIQPSVHIFADPSFKAVTIRVNGSGSFPLEAVFTDPAGRVIIKRAVTCDFTTIDLAGLCLPSVLIYTIRGPRDFFSAGKIMVRK